MLINTNPEYEAALAEANRLMDFEPGSADERRLCELADAIEAYEEGYVTRSGRAATGPSGNLELRAKGTRGLAVMAVTTICFVAVFSWFTCRAFRQSALDNALLEEAPFGSAAETAHLIAQGANVNVREPYGETPLMLAAFYGRTPVVQCLLAHGARVDYACERGETALLWARRNGHTGVENLLVVAGERR